MKNDGNNEGRIIQSVEKAVKILNLFLENEGNLAIKDIAEKMGLPRPTIHSLVNTLKVYNYLEQDPLSSRYQLGPAMFRLGLQYIKHKDILSVISVWIERLSFRFRKSVNVCMIVSKQVVVIYKVDPDDVIISYPAVGSVVPIHNTSNGKILLAYASDEMRESILKEYHFDKVTESTISNKEDFEKELRTVRNDAIAFNRDEAIIGVSSVGGPIYNHSGQVTASFAISGATDFFMENQETIVNEVKRTAIAISNSLGYKGKIF